MKGFKGVSAIAITTCLLIVHQNCIGRGSATPITAINRLPSITIDTLYENVPDSQQSGSSTFSRQTTVQGKDDFLRNQYRPQRQEARYVTLFRLPWRLARSASQKSFDVASSVASTFAQQFMDSYKHMQRNLIPQASEAISTWAFPPTNPPELSTAWLDGGV